ncbi:hemagglutinin repeat-containing protein [Xylella fastidiosa]|uniref:Hemagglutinin n=1 Tax=Xylella fastidiosa subsp. sandyi Ann-1 TaxID=155920 RepID=A0A060H6E2_XYLFS|nr:hemagglutinin repeat-containing protein [Xylella fastidiosa]AIC11168.1 hypothetical protein D934_05670 [Xylella fastidiosa subsp. sandyi Ann-1]UIX80158.1 hypothetical protein LZ756_06435 [Xylella fastidiosa subsp. sandyi]
MHGILPGSTSTSTSTSSSSSSSSSSQSQSQSSMSARTARSTQLRAGGDIAIMVFGVYELDEKGKPTLKTGTGNINATAAQFSSHNLNLTAAGNLNAHSAQSTQE